MIREHDAVLRRAQDFARDRGWRQEPLTPDEVEVLAALAGDHISTDYQVGHDDGYTKGYDDAMAKPLRLSRVQDWCADNGFVLVEKTEEAADDIQNAFEPAVAVRLVAQDDFQALFRCKICAALIEGSCRAWHRSWHLTAEPHCRAGWTWVSALHDIWDAYAELFRRRNRSVR